MKSKHFSLFLKGFELPEFVLHPRTPVSVKNFLNRSQNTIVYAKELKLVRFDMITFIFMVVTLIFCVSRIGLRSSHQRCSMKEGVLRNFTKFTEKHLYKSLFFNKVVDLRPATLLKRDSGTGIFL